ncbi:MAG: hypothetical protein R2795_20890 [Saprospiraceae bacterium]
MRVKRDVLYQADADLLALERSGLSTATVKGVREEWQVRKVEQQDQIAAADKKLASNPNDTAALRIKAEASSSMGQFTQAKTAATTLLKIDPQNLSAITTLLEVSDKVRDSQAVKTQIQQIDPKLLDAARNRVWIPKHPDGNN